MAKIALIGSGISALATAWKLKQARHECVIFELGESIGGAIRSYRDGPYLAEEGPNSIQLNNPEIEAFFKTIPGLTGRMITADQRAKKRFIVRNGQLRAVPTGPLSAITTNLWSLKGKLRLLKEPLISPPKKEIDESVADFVRRRLGNELYEYAINPLVGGIYAGDPEKLSLRYGFPKLYELEHKHGGLIRGGITKQLKAKSERNGRAPFQKRIISFKDGLKELPEKIADALGGSINRNVRLTQIKQSGKVWALKWSSNKTEKSDQFDRLLLTIPPHVLSTIPVESELRSELQKLASIEYPPVSVLSVAYKRSHISHPLDGFGALIPEKEGKNILGVLFPTSVFEGRAPKDEIMLTVFIGGSRQPALASPDETVLIETVREDLNNLLGISGEPTFTHLRHWSKAIPQYTIGYGAYLDTIQSIEAKYSGLHIAGNFRNGISLTSCLEAALRSVEELKL